jgi:hypothetical protein
MFRVVIVPEVMLFVFGLLITSSLSENWGLFDHIFNAVA